MTFGPRTLVNGVEIPNAAGGGGGAGGPACVPMVYGNESITATTTTRYLSPAGVYSGTSSAPTMLRPIVMQGAGTLKRLTIRIDSGAGNDNIVDYTVLLNGAPTGLTLSLVSTSAGQFDISADVAYVDGDEIGVEVAKAVSIGTGPDGIQAFIQVECAGGGSSGGDFDPLTNLIYVAKNGNDTTGTGSIAKPYLTFTKAYSEIGDAADNTEWNDATTRYYVVIVAPGVYSENAALPVRPSVWTYLYGASIVGDVVLAFPDNLITSGIESPQWGFKGNGRRAVWNDSGTHTINGIQGNLRATLGTGNGSFFPEFHLIETGVTEDFAIGSGSFSGAQLFMDDAVIGVNIDNASTSQLSVWARGRNNEQGGDIEGIGNVRGTVNLFHLSDILLRGAEIGPNASVDSWRWYNVRLLDGGAFDFSLPTGIQVQMDEPSWREYTNAVDIENGAGLAEKPFVMDGDPFDQVVDENTTTTWNGPNAAAVVGALTLTDLEPGDYHFLFGSEVIMDGEVLVVFDLQLGGGQIPGTRRTMSNDFGNVGESLGLSLSIDIIVEGVIPADVFTVNADPTANVDSFTVTQFSFRAIRVGPKIKHIGGV